MTVKHEEKEVVYKKYENVEVLYCDGCEKGSGVTAQRLIDIFTIAQVKHGWMGVKTSDKEEDNFGGAWYHFCSNECLIDWAITRKQK